MKTAICNFEKVRGEEAWEATECNFIENPYCNCKKCEHNKGFKKTRLISGKPVVLVDCNFSNKGCLETQIDDYVEMSIKALKDSRFEDALEHIKELRELTVLFQKED